MEHTEITDNGLEKLQTLKSLRSLYLSGTSVTAEGVAKFKQALPNCQVAHDSPPAATEKTAPVEGPSSDQSQADQLKAQIRIEAGRGG